MNTRTNNEIEQESNANNKSIKNCCCASLEYGWLKNESCCFCCGIRCALLTLCIFLIIDGIESTGMGMFFLVGKHRSWIGAVIDFGFGVGSLIFGIIGYYGIYKTNERAIRLFWYGAAAGIPIMMIIFIFAIIEFAMNDVMYLVVIMACDMMISTPLWIYCAYKIKRYHNLVFAHYYQLSDGIKEEEKQKHQENADKE
eukprot:142724_1